MNVVLFALIASTIYFAIENFCERNILQKINKYISVKNEYYYREFLKKYEKSKKIKITERMNIVYKINLLIDKAGITQNILVNPFSIIFYGIISFIFTYLLAFSIFRIIGISIIIAIPSSFVPFSVLNSISSHKSEKIEKMFLNFLLQLKNYTKINNDVIGAFKNVQTIEPLQSYLNKFNLEINSGINFEVALEHLKERIVIKKFKEFFSNVQYCYVYGGDFSCLIDKSYKMIKELQDEKNRRKHETQGARVVLTILLFLNIFVYINFVKNNLENYMIMKNTVVGITILYWNFISMWLLLFLSEKVKKLDY